MGNWSQTLAFWITFVYFFIVLIIDLCFFTVKEQAKNFYLWMSLVFVLGLIANIMIFFNVPERYCMENRISQLYFQSHFWLALS